MIQAAQASNHCWQATAVGKQLLLASNWHNSNRRICNRLEKQLICLEVKRLSTEPRFEKKIMNRRSNLYLYLLLNILVSAVTTLIVLWAWDHFRSPASLGSAPLAAPPAVVQDTVAPQAANLPAVSPTPAVPVETVQPTGTMPPTGGKVIQITSVVGVGDLEQEVVLIKRAGAGNLRIVGWKLAGEHNNTYTFPEQPELILYKDGAIQVYSKAGTDSVTEVYWNRSDAAWRSGELIRLLDPQGNERATYKVP